MFFGTIDLGSNNDIMKPLFFGGFVNLYIYFFSKCPSFNWEDETGLDSCFSTSNSQPVHGFFTQDPTARRIAIGRFADPRYSPRVAQLQWPPQSPSDKNFFLFFWALKWTWIWMKKNGHVFKTTICCGYGFYMFFPPETAGPTVGMGERLFGGGFPVRLWRIWKVCLGD